MKDIKDKILETREKFWERKMEQISVGDIFYNYIKKDGSINFYKVISKGRKAIKCQELETSIAKRSPNYAKPGASIEGKFYLMKNETIHGEWCCPYTESEPASLYKNSFKK